ncbi:pentatricopeptide repeat-containing protein At2g17140 [Humulus lupulus]|uniref:pentatricopeptide repeat-containing protein At2g17140 n=1 Tax=Humulus lupulus TaxID=3486 RepID=UPI002B4087B1|nr:pentatricopeptide repeat-containing protein At2g17140 [Humulus lupulus]
MDQATTFAKALLKNTNNPKLAWLLFKRTLSSPISTSSDLTLRSVPIVARILVGAKMDREIDSLHQLLLRSEPPETAHACGVSLVRILAKSGLPDKAVSQFKSLRLRFPNKLPSAFLYNLLLESSVRARNVDFVLWLYKDMIVSGVDPETYTFNLLISALCDFGHVDDAREMFDKMRDKGCCPNEFSIGLLVRGYCRAGFSDKALEILDKTSDILPKRVVYNTLISSFCKEGRTEEAEKLVERMRASNMFPDVVTFNSRISALCHSGKILEASRIFRDMHIDEELGLPKPNIITYNLMLEGFCKEGMVEEARSLFESMKRKSDVIHLESYNIWLLALMRSGKLLEARLLLKEMVDQGLELSVCTYNILIDGLCKNGMISDAKMVMGLMTSNGISPDTVTYTTLLHGYCKRGKVFDANRVLQEMMINNCAPNAHTCNILLHSLWKEGRTSEAEKLLQKMNERGYGIDTVTCNIVIDGLCNNGKLNKAIEIVSGMWTHGRAALGHLGNSFIGLVDDSNNGKNCRPDLITYSIIISGMCKAGKLDEAKKKFSEMMGKKLHPDSMIYDTFIHGFCKEGKITSAFRVLKDMEKKGCNKSLQTYNSLILGLGSKNQIFEIYGLLDDMKEKGVSPDVCTYNNMISCLCEVGRIKDATSLLDEMLQKGISPNIPSFKILIKAFCKACEFEDVQEVFEIALSVCGHKEALYSLMFNEFFLGGEVSKAKEIFEAALERNLCVGNFLYKDLIDKLCKDEKLEEASGFIYYMIDKGYGFDPASFMPVIDGLGKKGNKPEADLLAERMMEMASEGSVKDKVYRRGEIDLKNSHKSGGSDWQTIVHRNDGSGVALKTLKRVEKGWGRESILSSQPQHNEFVDYEDANN